MTVQRSQASFHSSSRGGCRVADRNADHCDGLSGCLFDRSDRGLVDHSAVSLIQPSVAKEQLARQADGTVRSRYAGNLDPRGVRGSCCNPDSQIADSRCCPRGVGSGLRQHPPVGCPIFARDIGPRGCGAIHLQALEHFDAGTVQASRADLLDDHGRGRRISDGGADNRPSVPRFVLPGHDLHDRARPGNGHARSVGRVNRRRRTDPRNCDVHCSDGCASGYLVEERKNA